MVDADVVVCLQNTTILWHVYIVGTETAELLWKLTDYVL